MRTIFNKTSLIVAVFVMTMACSALLHPAAALSYNGPTGAVQCDVGDSSFAVKVVYCVKLAVFTTTQTFLAQTSAAMIPIVSAVMALSITLLGVRIVTGERDPQKMVFAMLLKFGIVWLFVDNLGQLAFDGGLTGPIFRTMEQLQAAIIPTMYQSGTCQLGNSGLSGSYLDPVTFEPWEYIDCILDYVFGFGVQASIASSIFGFIGSAFFSGTMGMMVFTLGISLVLSLAFFAFRAVYIVLLCYIYVGFLIVLSPLFIPLLMFKVTEDAFNKWLWNLIGGIFQPLVMVAYLALAMPLLDTMVFGEGDQSLVKTLGKGKEITDKYRLASPIMQGSMSTEFDFFDKLSPGNILKDPLDSTKTGGMDMSSLLTFSKVDLGEQQIQDLWKIGMSLLRILGVTFLILSIAKFIPELTARIVGGGFSLSADTQSPMLFETAIRGGLRNMGGMVTKSGGQQLSGLMRKGVPGAK